MSDAAKIDSSPPRDPADWVDAILLRDAGMHADEYIADDGFTARVMRTLPPVGMMPAWRKPAVVALWAVAGVLLAVALPGLAYDVARTAYALFAAKPFSLSTVALVVVAVGIASATAAAVALRRD